MQRCMIAFSSTKGLLSISDAFDCVNNGFYCKSRINLTHSKAYWLSLIWKMPSKKTKSHSIDKQKTLARDYASNYVETDPRPFCVVGTLRNRWQTESRFRLFLNRPRAVFHLRKTKIQIQSTNKKLWPEIMVRLTWFPIYMGMCRFMSEK